MNPMANHIQQTNQISDSIQQANPVFDHICQAKYLLQQLLESGFLSGRGFESELHLCQQSAQALGLETGSKLAGQLSANLSQLRAGQGHFGHAALIYSALTAYYDFVADKLILENLTSPTAS